MRFSAVATLTMLSVQFFFLHEVSEQLAGGKQAAAARGKKTPASFREEDGGRDLRRQPSTGPQKAEGGTGAQDGSSSQAQWEANKLTPSSKKQLPQLPPPKTKSHGLHLKGHGKFNTDTHSCFGIHLKTCKRPSDCDGCLGLYTCKLPRGKCDLKAVSRKTGSFSRSIQNR